MSFTWIEYLALAEESSGGNPVNSPSEEARQRSAISRAYYAAFHVCLDKLGSRIPAYQNSHLAVIEYFQRNQNKAYKDIGTRLHRLLLDRRMADYDDEMPRLDWLTAKAIANAQAIINLVANI